MGGCINFEYINVIGLILNLYEVSVGFDKVFMGWCDFLCIIIGICLVNVKQFKVSQVEWCMIEEKLCEVMFVVGG